MTRKDGDSNPTNYRTAQPSSRREDMTQPGASPEAPGSLQQRVQPWMMACFGPEISADRIERNHRFLEESLELVQSTGCTQSEAHQLVEYVFGRPVGETHQEIGGVMITLAALCLAIGEDMHVAGETELARIWTKVEKIRAKQAAKPKHSPLPEAAPPADQAQADAREVLRRVEWAVPDGLSTGFCPSCGNFHEDGHTATCALAAALRDPAPDGRDAELLDLLGSAQFEAGAWTKDDADEPYEAIHTRASLARLAVDRRVSELRGRATAAEAALATVRDDHDNRRKAGVRQSVTWLHERAKSMNDQHAQAILNTAAFALGNDLARTASDGDGEGRR